MSQAGAYRVIEQIEQAYELRLGAVTLPDGTSDTVIFTPCSTCRTMSLRVSDQTRYFIAGQPVELGELRERADALRATIDGQQRVGVYVYYDPASLRVTRLRMSP
jgi:hypothetical protein